QIRGTARNARPKEGATKDDKKQEAIDRVLEVFHSVEQDYDPLWGSLLKQTIRRVFPGFSEGYYGYGSFSGLLEEMQHDGLLELDYDDSRGNYKVRRAKG
ncbi:MAG TPA: OST-HTH/LOTUS domain-containing protein, partial [Pirellulales bacterium]|nr:OST-HTH/LOTUS domain-containing protein [Pirellulales bacterium]